MKREDFISITKENIEYCKKEIANERNCSDCKKCPFNKGNLKNSIDCIQGGYRDKTETNKIKEVMKDFLETFDVNSFKNKVVEIKYSPIFDDKYAWSISYQNNNIIKRGEFIDNEFNVVSCSYPYYIKGVLGLRGFVKKNDNKIMVNTKKEMAEIISTINKINLKYRVNNRVQPYFNEEYYFINSMFKIEKSIWKLNDIDKERLEVLNCFSTKSLAESKLKEIQKILKVA